MNKEGQALAREAGLATEHLAIGATALGKANYAQQAYYSQAFFALTTGFERATKLAFVVDYALENKGTFPEHRALRRYGHNLDKLLKQADEIAERRALTGVEDRLPRTAIHEGIVEVLSDFASNITRYYNLDFVTGDPRTVERDDPIFAWFDLVIDPILNVHYKPHHRDKHRRNAQLVSELLSGHAMVYYHSERGEVIDTALEASMRTGAVEFAGPYARMYVMQIARFLARLFLELTHAAYVSRLDTIPHLSEFFAIFNNSDIYFKQQKTWSTYRP
jgi:hypothetical protein